MDQAARSVGVDFIGGYSAQVQKGASAADDILMETLPQALLSTGKVCASINVGSSRAGINMTAVGKLGKIIKQLAEGSREQDGFACAKLVVFTNQPEDNPFMAGAYHGHGEPEVVINVGVSGPGVVRRALERRIEHDGAENLGLDDLAEEIKQTSCRVTRCGELIGREVAKRLGIGFGIVDLSLAPTPKFGCNWSARIDGVHRNAERRRKERRRIRIAIRRRFERCVHSRVGGFCLGGSGRTRRIEHREA